MLDWCRQVKVYNIQNHHHHYYLDNSGYQFILPKETRSMSTCNVAHDPTAHNNHKPPRKGINVCTNKLRKRANSQSHTHQPQIEHSVNQATQTSNLSQLIQPPKCADLPGIPHLKPATSFRVFDNPTKSINFNVLGNKIYQQQHPSSEQKLQHANPLAYNCQPNATGFWNSPEAHHFNPITEKMRKNNDEIGHIPYDMKLEIPMDRNPEMVGFSSVKHPLTSTKISKQTNSKGGSPKDQWVFANEPRPRVNTMAVRHLHTKLKAEEVQLSNIESYHHPIPNTDNIINPQKSVSSMNHSQYRINLPDYFTNSNTDSVPKLQEDLFSSVEHSNIMIIDHTHHSHNQGQETEEKPVESHRDSKPVSSSSIKVENLGVFQRKNQLQVQKNQLQVQNQQYSATVSKKGTLKSKFTVTPERRAQLIDRDTIISKSYYDSFQEEKSMRFEESVILEHDIKSQFKMFPQKYWEHPQFRLYIALERNNLIVSIKQILNCEMHLISKQIRLYDELSLSNLTSAYLILELYQVTLHQNRYIFIKEPFCLTFADYLHSLKSNPSTHEEGKPLSQIIDTFTEEFTTLVRQLELSSIYLQNLWKWMIQQWPQASSKFKIYRFLDSKTLKLGLRWPQGSSERKLLQFFNEL